MMMHGHNAQKPAGQTRLLAQAAAVASAPQRSSASIRCSSITAHLMASRTGAGDAGEEQGRRGDHGDQEGASWLEHGYCSEPSRQDRHRWEGGGGERSENGRRPPAQAGERRHRPDVERASKSQKSPAVEANIFFDEAERLGSSGGLV